jgi:hypothetical protein
MYLSRHMAHSEVLSAAELGTPASAAAMAIE